MASSSRPQRHRVRAHYRKNGTYVRGHYRARRGTGPASSSSRSTATAAAGSGLGFLVFFVIVAVFLELAQRAG